VNEKGSLEIIDISGKKEIECPHCGFLLKIQPRTISMEKLRHMEDVKQIVEWKKKHTNADANCGKPIICKDEFSIEQ
jgi:DNA-directed RNA polymerase subunit RPC12/RpoP